MMKVVHSDVLQMLLLSNSDLCRTVENAKSKLNKPSFCATILERIRHTKMLDLLETLKPVNLLK